MESSTLLPQSIVAALEELASSRTVEFGQPCWEDLLNSKYPLTKISPAALEAATSSYCVLLERNNVKTRNFQRLLHQAAVIVRNVRSSTTIFGATNALTISRIVLKHLSENLNASQLVTFLNLPASVNQEDLPEDLGQGTDALQYFTRAVLEAAITVPLSDDLYVFHLELLHLLLVMCSTQLYTPAATALPGAHPLTEALMRESDLSGPLLQVLLSDYVERRAQPLRASIYIPPAKNQGGVFRIVRSAAASVLWFPLKALTFLVRSGSSTAADSPLGDTALLLLLVLLHHSPSRELGFSNPFHSALCCLQDANDEQNRGTG
eukprot:jgi/Botrbrau1/9145/Bobra.160_3s0018.1